MREAPQDDTDESHLTIGEKEDHAAGPTAVAVSMKRAVEGMVLRRTARTLPRLNQADGFDCQGCAWPDPEHRHVAEFCENGVKAFTDEATLRRVGRKFFVALDSKATGSNQPAYKSIVVRLTPSVPDAPASGRPQPVAHDPSPDAHTEPQRYVAPHHLS